MGNAWTKSREVKVLILGLDSAGKTAIQYRLKDGEFVNTIPSIGLNVETIHCENMRFDTWDLSAKEKVRRLWGCYFKNTEALIFVVDSSDYDRISECKDELWRFLNEDELKNVVVLIMANKQDLPNAMSATEIASQLEVHKSAQRIHVLGTSARTGEGLQEGMALIMKELTS